MLAALERAGISPVETDQLHAFAFFANVLSPLWDLEPLQGSVLKRKAGPFFKELQDALDQFVGWGAVDVVELAYRDVEANGARLAAKFRISLKHAEPSFAALEVMPDEIEIAKFLEQLAFVFAEIEPKERDEAVEVDATYSAPDASNDRVVDFAEWRDPKDADHSVRAAKRLQLYAPNGVTLSQAEELVLYMRLMKRKARAVSA